MEGALWMSSVPKGNPTLREPADAYSLEVADRERRQANAEGRFGKFGGLKAVQSASQLVSIYRNNFISLGTQQEMLTSVHELHELKLLVEDNGNPVSLLVPRTLTALYERANASRYLDDDIRMTKSFLCMAFLSQTAMIVPLVRSDVGAVIQSILLDDAYEPGAFRLSYRGEQQVYYCDADGCQIHGYEPWQTPRWRALLQTIPNGGYMLCLSVHSDGVASENQEKYPYSIVVENFPTESRPGVRTQRVFAMGSHPDIRKPRGSSIPEKLDPQQKVIKYAIQSRVASEMLSDLEVLAATGADFFIRSLDGSIQRVKLFIRLYSYKADMAEQQAITGVRSYDCTGCFGHQFAIRDGRGRAGSDNRPHIDRSEGGYCATALKRTVANVAKRQALCASLARTENFTAADALSSKLGVRFKVECSLSRLYNFIPHSAGGIYTCFGLDVLHGMRTGVFPKACFTADCAMLKFHAEAEEFKSIEDVRDEVDSRLMSLGPRYGHPSFKSGFWGSGDIGHTKGSEVTALLELLPFVFAGCDLLIADRRIRVIVLDLLCTLARLGVEAYTRQYYTDEEHIALDLRVRHCIDLMHDVMDAITSGGRVMHIPGHIFDIPKAHRLQGFARDTIYFGSLRNIDTEGGELSMKHLKKANKLSSPETDPTDSFLLARLASLDMDNSATATLRRTGPPRSRNTSVAVFSMHRNLVGRGLSWMLVSKALKDAVNGPAFTTVEIGNAVALVSEAASASASSTAADLSAVTTEIYFYGEVSVPCVDPKVSSYLFRHGHCCQTTSGHFVQIVLPVVSLANGHFNCHTTGMGLEHQSYSLVCTFVHVSPASPMYPEMRSIPWLCRGPTRLLPTNELVRRVQVVPLFGQAHRPTGDLRTHYLVNNLADPFFAGPSKRCVYRRCQTPACTGLLSKPALCGSSVSCAICTKSVHWF